MSETVTRVRLFVASTNDLAEEHAAMRVVIDELNHSIASDRKLVLELVSWHTHAWPGVGTDPQDVINQEVGSSDIFIGIIWKRLGTPTPRAASGTVEEFERAYARWLSRKYPQILLYFKCTPFFPQSLEEIENLAQVTTFRMRLRDKGVLYWEYRDMAEFQRDFRQHLSSVLLSSTPAPSVPSRAKPDPETFMDRLADLKMLFEALPLLRVLPVSVIHVDLDNFKRFNDRFGYEQADEFLGRVGKVLSDSVGAKGTLYRIGGDEFAVVMTGARSRDANKLAQDLQLCIRTLGKTFGGVTASFGLATCHSKPNRDLLRGAHTATFVSKVKGCNAITVYPLSPRDRELFEMAVARGLS
jgi:diguanylate cyclase (GGDEF)-like protein